ncbi:helix-turn-helix transcriptional regulator [Chromobacterium piscinae]|uniref:helix-turn-helix domain-containing protein n=1 Tax=Chromobacterium piscinae TaxID=686831 RepID=UPI0032088A0E
MQNPRDIRRSTGLNQQQFWSALGVTQSGGSRYENERNIPKPVQTLMNVVHVHGIDLSKITAENAQVIRALLAGELDVSALLKTAEHMRKLSAAAAGIAAEAANTSLLIHGVKEAA